jgi:hypothetical protein
MGVWEIIASDEYNTWFLQQSEGDQAVIHAKVLLLEEHGPNLGRPHADILKGGSLGNLKELRAKTLAHVFRVAYLFDEERKGILLTGGDKKGRNQKRFYKDLIKDAEKVYAAYLEKKGEKGKLT